MKSGLNETHYRQTTLLWATACALSVAVGCAEGISEEGSRESRPMDPSGSAVPLKSGVQCSPRQVTGYSNGTPKDITVVEIDGMSVELATANAYAQMQAAAANDGVALRVVSGFRSQSEQRALYACYVNCNCNNCNLAAYPGHSNHQSGLALDLNTVVPGVLRWLDRNGAHFGFARTVPSEDWHWEYFGGVDGGPCDDLGRARVDDLALVGFAEGAQLRNGQWLKVASEDPHLHHVEYHVDGYLTGVSENKGEGFPLRLVLNTVGRRTVTVTGYDVQHRETGASEVTVTFIEDEKATPSLKFTGLRSTGWYRNGLVLGLENAPEATQTVEYKVGPHVLGTSSERDGFAIRVQLQTLGYRALEARALGADGHELAQGSILIRVLPGADDLVDPSVMFLSPQAEDARPRTVEMRLSGSDSVASIHLEADGWSLGKADFSDGLWRRTHRFSQVGERRLVATARDDSGQIVAYESVVFTVR